jgi:hypothetical protein
MNKIKIKKYVYNVLSFSFRGLSKVRITMAKVNDGKPLSFEGLCHCPLYYRCLSLDPGFLHKDALLLLRKPRSQTL